MRTEFRRMLWALAICLSGLATLVIAVLANAQDNQGQVQRVLVLKPSPDGFTSGPFGHTGQAGVVHISVEEGRTTLQFSLSGLSPNAVHTVWLLLDSGANPCGPDGPACLAPFLSCNGPACVVPNAASPTGKTNVFAFSPAAADDAGFTAGMGLDPNGFVSDADGNADFTITLNYDLFQSKVAPTVLRPTVWPETLAVAFDPLGTTCFSSASGNFPARIDSAYMRSYDISQVANLPGISPSYQLLDSNGKPQLVRAGVRAFELIEHFDRLTHGHLPGFHVANPAASSCGDFDNRLTGSLADAVPED